MATRNHAASHSNSQSRPQTLIPQSISHAARVPQRSAQSRQPQPKTKPSPAPFWQRLRQGWHNFNISTRLAILLVGSAALPVIVVTQGIIMIAEHRLFLGLQESLQKELTFLEQEIDQVQQSNKLIAANLAELVETNGIDLSNQKGVFARRALLTDFVQYPINDQSVQSFRILTDAQGRTVAQNIQILAEDFSSYPPLPIEDGLLTVPDYRPVLLPRGIELGDIPIVKDALSTGRPLAGTELLPGEILQRLGLEKQAGIGLRSQKSNLSEPKQPFPEGTYDIDQGRAGLAIVAVQPIRVKGKQVGAAIVATLLNRNYQIVDDLKRKTGVATATLFAQDWGVSTNVPYTDGKTRAIGTRVSREVAAAVLYRGENFVGPANIIGLNYLTAYSPLYDHRHELNQNQAKPVGIAYVGEPETKVQSTLATLALAGYGFGGGILLLAGLIAVPLASKFSPLLRDQEEPRPQEAEPIQLFSSITLRIRHLDWEDILKTAVEEVQQALKTERVLIYRLDSNWDGTIVAESVMPGSPKALGVEIQDTRLKERHGGIYNTGRVRALNPIYQPGLTDCHIKLSEQLVDKATLVAPILVNNQLFGLMIAHECSEARPVQQYEIDLFTQLATQIGIALEQAHLLEQIKFVSLEQLQQKKALQLFKNMALRIRQSLNLEAIFKATVEELRQVLKADRVVICRFNSNSSTVVIAESVAPGWTQALGTERVDTCFKESSRELYKTVPVRTRAIEDIYQAGLPDCYVKQVLERFEVKATLVVPILAKKQLFGLMIAHQCSSPRAWQQFEIDLFTQVATQVGIAVNQASLLNQLEKAHTAAEVVSLEQYQQKQLLSSQLGELRSLVESVSRGDLSVYAQASAGEISTVVDFFNLIVEGLRQIVTQVKTAAHQVNVSVGESAGAIHQLADEALQQTEEITYTLDSLLQMTQSIQAVADNARTAAVVARTASTTAEAGEAAMDRTVQTILNLRSTVVETANKVKRLGESSQQISQVVFLINQIALQTNVLAINASIEATRAGEAGRGFAVMASEVGQLAAQSAAASKEIEQIVANIQRETSEVVTAMELGTTQVIAGTHQVEDTKKSLGQILDVSRQVDHLVHSISTATMSQAQISEVVTKLMKQIAKVAERTSDSSRQVSSSLRQTVEVAQQLEASVGALKVGGGK